MMQDKPGRKKRPTIDETDDDSADLTGQNPATLEEYQLKKLGTKVERIVITPPNFSEMSVRIVGNAPYCQNKFSSENRKKMMDKQEQGSRSRKGTLRSPKDFEKIYQGTMHISTEGWHGIPCSALRNGMVSACRLVGFKMTIAKLSLFVTADGIDDEDGQPLTKILVGTPKRRDMAVKLADGGTDILPRAFFDKWETDLHLKWDADQFGNDDVLNLLTRVGIQVGIGAGRPDSKNSCGMGWGTFDVINQSAKISQLKFS